MEKLRQDSMYGLSSMIMTDLSEVFAQYHSIEQVLIFGSRAKNSYKSGSDIDLAVVSSTLTEQEFTELWDKIDQLAIIFKIDLLHLNKLKNTLLKIRIQDEGRVFYQKS